MTRCIYFCIQGPLETPQGLLTLSLLSTFSYLYNGVKVTLLSRAGDSRMKSASKTLVLGAKSFPAALDKGVCTRHAFLGALAASFAEALRASDL